jgi:16S rRNA (guanine527-N7)-methyltransferase
VAKLAVLAELCLPFVRPGGYFAAYKSIGSATEAERAEAERALRILGGRWQGAVPFSFYTKSEEEINHQIIDMEKVQKTPANYPRKAGIPEKKPL